MGGKEQRQQVSVYGGDNELGVDSSGQALVSVGGIVDVNIVSGGGVSTIDDGDVHVQTITGTSDVACVAASSGLVARIHKIVITNNSIPCTVEFRFGSGTYIHQVALGAKRLTRTLTFSPALEGTVANTAFNGHSDTASVDVDITVHAELV